MIWLFARTANHIGASMLIYGLAAFLISYGLLKRELVPVIISVLVAVVYGFGMLGGLLAGTFPTRSRVYAATEMILPAGIACRSSSSSIRKSAFPVGIGSMLI
ncbi:MAG: hypothetical protein D3908_03490 [Candidatus Electrothrix sp. AUS4]|nr:hypothetical protein [Candidatus Electrothrix sp. AUS4]